jgi:N-acetyl sugar amidotransferase
MDTTDPDISFNSAGVCNHCSDYDRSVRETVVAGAEGLRRLDELVSVIKRSGKGKRYDCVIGVSGGVDSTFVAYKVKQLGLRPIAVHLDNGWDSEIAVGNISAALRVLGIDLHSEVIDWEEFKDIQLSFLRAGVPDCEIPSDHAIVAAVHRTAARFGVRYTIWGYNTKTESHLPKAWSQGHHDWGYIRAIHRRYGSGKGSTFPHFGFLHFVTGFRMTQTRLNLLDYIDYSKKDALKILEKEVGWRSYGGKHHESVYTRWYQGWFLPARFGYDKRKTHLSSLICSGEISRADALRDLDQPAYPVDLQQADTEYVIKKLGLSPMEFQLIMTAPKQTFSDFPSYWKRYHGPAFRTALRAYQIGKYGILRFPRGGR